MTARKRNYTLSELLTGVLMGAMVGFVLSVLASATLEGMTINRTADSIISKYEKKPDPEWGAINIFLTRAWSTYANVLLWSKCAFDYGLSGLLIGGTIGAALAITQRPEPSKDLESVGESNRV